MTNKSLIILWVIVGSLLILTLKVRSGFTSPYAPDSKLQVGAKLLNQIDVEQIAKIKVIRSGESYELVRKGRNWVAENLDDFPVQASLIVREIGGLWDSEVTQPMKASAKYHARFGLSSGSANMSELDFLNASGESLERVFLGDAIKASGTDASSGRWVRLGSDPNTIYSLTEEHRSVDQPVSFWLVKDFLEVKKIASIRRTIEFGDRPLISLVNGKLKIGTLKEFNRPLKLKGQSSWAVNRREPESSFEVKFLTEFSETNPRAMKGFDQFLVHPKFFQVVGKMSLDEWYDSRGKGVIYRMEVETFDGFRYQLRVTAAQTGQTNKDFIFSYKVEFDPTGKVSPELISKFEKERDFSKYLYLVKKSAILPIFKNRMDLLRNIKAP